MQKVIFPFTAVVGQERMKRALILNAVSPQIGGVLIRGERGTAKSTAARALAALLPDMEVVVDCRFGCDPAHSESWCDECRARHDKGEKLPTTTRQTRIVDLPVSATEDRVVGTLDIEKAIQEGKRYFDAGVLAAANRGILYVDEVNLLDDHVVDLLLDSAAMGINVVEREGISFTHPARFILIGTMNPEEGDLRPQLLDRFALCVDVHGIMAPVERMAILERHVSYEQDPMAFRENWLEQEQRLSDEIAQGRLLVDKVVYTRRDMATIANLTASLQVDGHRADLVILKTARAHAAFEGRTEIDERDILLAAELALPHRVRKGPFQEAQISLNNMEERLEQARNDADDAEMTEEESESNQSDEKKDSESVNEETTEETPEAQPTEAARQNVFQSQDSRWWEGGQKVQPGQEFKLVRRLDTPLDKLTRKQGGRRSSTRTDRKRGRYIQARPFTGKLTDLAFDATLRAAAPFQLQRDHHGLAFAIRKSDLHRKIRVKKQANLVLFVVDASWSMAVAERMTATKGAILSLLTDAYQRRDRVGLIVFQKNRAQIVLPPTNSVQLAQKALADIPVGGKTPLSAGLLLAYEVFKRDKVTHPDVLPLMILLTDGAGNVSISNGSPQEEAHRIAELMSEEQIKSVVVNMEHASFDQGLAQRLAERLGGACYSLHELRADLLYQTVRQEMNHL